MHRNRYLTLVLAFAAGLLGGLVSRYITPPSVRAETQPPNALEIRAQRFTVVDAKGHVIGTFTGAVAMEEGMGNRALPRIALIDPTGRELWSAGGLGLKPLAENSR